jgi:TetR/AcrR family transcriptional regulator, transcriptional repressor for nem operon
VTASVTSGTPGKRDRLIAGARETIYRQGFEATTIADIAEASDVPLGNVYYYFKSSPKTSSPPLQSTPTPGKPRAAVAARVAAPYPQARLKTLVRLIVSQPDQVALYGCPRGSLCSELGKQDNDLARAGRALTHTAIAWIEQQFKAMGRRDARDLAFALLASYEGTELLANTFRDPDLMVREGHRLERWIDSLARDRKVAPAG